MRPVSAPRHCAAYPRTANAPSPRRGFGGTLKCLQGHAVTSGWRERSSPSLSTLCGPPRHCRATQSSVTTSRCCWSAGDKASPRLPLYRVRAPLGGTLESARGGGRTTNHYAVTLETAPVRAQDAPGRLDRSRICQDGRQLRGTTSHTSIRREIVRHTCKLLPP
jgi:hypothetical protein